MIVCTGDNIPEWGVREQKLSWLWLEDLAITFETLRSKENIAHLDTCLSNIKNPLGVLGFSIETHQLKTQRIVVHWMLECKL